MLSKTVPERGESRPFLIILISCKSCYHIDRHPLRLFNLEPHCIHPKSPVGYQPERGSLCARCEGYPFTRDHLVWPRPILLLSLLAKNILVAGGAQIPNKNRQEEMR